MTTFGQGKHAILWSRGLKRPFESDESLLVKLAWINDASDGWFKTLKRDLRKRSGDVYSTLHPNISDELTAPSSPLVDALPREGLLICPECMRAQFHSELPQLLGLEECPIHHRPFQRTCRKCGDPIFLGRPQFRHTSVYICEKCGEALSPDGASFLSNILSLPETRILSAFRPYLSGIETAHKKCAGQWYVHERYSPEIYYYLTGYRPTFVPHAPKSSTILNSRSVSEYTLPTDPELLNQELERVKAYDRCQLSGASERYLPHIEEWGRSPVVSFAEDWITYWRGPDLLKGAISLQENLIAHMWRGVETFPPIYVLPYLHGPNSRSHRQLQQIITSSSLHQIFRQLLLAEHVAAYYLNKSDDKVPTATAERRAKLACKLGNFAIHYIDFDKITLRTPLTSWLPSFQLQVEENMVRVRVFRTGVNRLFSARTAER